MYYEAFEKLCLVRGIKPIEVSRATGISTATLSSWKKGKYTPKSDKLQKIADFFQVSLDFLTTGEETEPNVQKDGQSDWYIDPETAKIAQEVFSDPDKRVLFDAARTARPEAIRFAAQLLEQWKETNPNG